MKGSCSKSKVPSTSMQQRIANLSVPDRQSNSPASREYCLQDPRRGHRCYRPVGPDISRPLLAAPGRDDPSIYLHAGTGGGGRRRSDAPGGGGGGLERAPSSSSSGIEYLMNAGAGCTFSASAEDGIYKMISYSGEYVVSQLLLWVNGGLAGPRASRTSTAACLCPLLLCPDAGRSSRARRSSAPEALAGRAPPGCPRSTTPRSAPGSPSGSMPCQVSSSARPTGCLGLTPRRQWGRWSWTTS